MPPFHAAPQDDARDEVTRRDFVAGILACAAAISLGATPALAMDGPDQDTVATQIPRQHEVTVKIRWNR